MGVCYIEKKNMVIIDEADKINESMLEELRSEYKEVFHAKVVTVPGKFTFVEESESQFDDFVSKFVTQESLKAGDEMVARYININKDKLARLLVNHYSKDFKGELALYWEESDEG